MIRKILSYLKTLFGVKAEAMMDPTIQLEQAVQEARKQDQSLRESAARVIAIRSEVEMKLTRAVESAAKAKASTMQALTKSDSATAVAEKEKWDRAASALAMELEMQERLVEGLKAQFEAATHQSEVAKEQVNQNAMRLKELTTKKLELLSKLEQAKMTESINKTLESINRPMDQQHVPNFTEIEDKINTRMANANAKAELEAGSLEGTTRELEQSMMQVSSASRLDVLRAEMSGDVIDAEVVEETPALNPANPANPLAELSAPKTKSKTPVKNKN